MLNIIIVSFVDKDVSMIVNSFLANIIPVMIMIIIVAFILNLNFSFDAILVIYITNTSNPPIMIINNIYEYQNLEFINPPIIAIIVVFVNKINAIDKGCFIIINRVEIIIKTKVNLVIIQRVV